MMTMQAERGWEVDLEDVVASADDDTSCIVVNNPSNPCGSVYSARHLRDILRVAERLRLPIIADEIYADFVRDSSFLPHCKNIRLYTNILWRVFHILTEPVRYT